MREVLIRSPSVAFAFGINASQFAGACAPTGPSQAARPPAEHVGSGGTAAVTTAASPVGCEEGFVWGQSPGERYVSPARRQQVHATVILFPLAPLHPLTPTPHSVATTLPPSPHISPTRH